MVSHAVAWRNARLCLRHARLSRYRIQPPALSTARFLSSTPAAYASSHVQKDVIPPRFQAAVAAEVLPRTELFLERHIGPDSSSAENMLKALDPPVSSLDEFVDQTLPANIRAKQDLHFDESPQLKTDLDVGYDKTGYSESSAATWLQGMARQNKITKSLIGCGYYETVTPPVIKRNVLENPAWYTSYTPYQAEISQGRLESLLNFQTLVTDLTGLAMANASVLDEGTAAAEAMTMSMNALPMSRQKKSDKCFVVSDRCHPQTIAVLESRANGFGIDIVVGDVLANDCQLVKDQKDSLIGVLAQYPDTYGTVFDFQHLADTVHKAQATFSVATDLLALTMLKSPAEFGADIAFGNSQRFGIPMGFGGPHAAFFACSEKLKRKIPGRLVGVSKDRLGNPALRLALQAREQHIRKERATSNICTAQALLANMASLYAVYHGPAGLRAIAERIWTMTEAARKVIVAKGFEISNGNSGQDGSALFDTFVVRSDAGKIKTVLEKAKQASIDFRPISDSELGVSFGEGISSDQFVSIVGCFGATTQDAKAALEQQKQSNWSSTVPDSLQRQTSYLTHPVFNTHHSETELLRYIYHLQSKDLSLVHSMISLGSCTMKLNATTEMEAIGDPHWASLHPFAPQENSEGYRSLVKSLSRLLINITGMDDVSLQPNSGAQGEFAGLRTIKKYQESKKDGKKRTVCLIPVTAHGTNPASAAMAGVKVVTLKIDTKTGNLDMNDLEEKCKKHADELVGIMITYPSTYGVFEPEIKRVCDMVHQHGGQVYMDGANMNAQIGLCSPGEIGADVCHLNLHKTFCIPHGGGGPGIGPIAVKEHLAPFLPSHPEADPQITVETSGRANNAIAPISAAPWGSASLLPISWSYIAMMGSEGLTYQTKIALLNANYIMSRLKPHYDIAYTNENGRCAHEFILDTRSFEHTAGIQAIDIAKRLQDYGFHAPTMSWPIANTLMIEPTESESQEELDRFCDALIEIRKEIKQVEDGNAPKEGNVLKMAPHPQHDLLRSEWDRPYTREQAAYPLPWLREKKFWPSVSRVDDAYGDTNLFCTCAPVEDYE